MNEVDAVLYREALLDLLRAARAFSHAMMVAADRAARNQADDPIAPTVAAECRAMIQCALAAAPGMHQLFTEETTNGVAADAADHVPAGQPAADQGG